MYVLSAIVWLSWLPTGMSISTPAPAPMIKTVFLSNILQARRLVPASIIQQPSRSFRKRRLAFPTPERRPRNVRRGGARRGELLHPVSIFEREQEGCGVLVRIV